MTTAPGIGLMLGLDILYCGATFRETYTSIPR